MKKTFLTILCIFTALALIGSVLFLTLLNPQFKPVKVLKLMQDGRKAMLEADYSAAIDSYRMVTYLDGGKVEAYLRIADIFMMQDEPEEALYFINLGLRVKPESKNLLQAKERLETIIAALNPPEDDDFDDDSDSDSQAPDDTAPSTDDEPDANTAPGDDTDPNATPDPNATADPNAAVDPNAQATPESGDPLESAEGVG